MCRLQSDYEIEKILKKPLATVFLISETLKDLVYTIQEKNLQFLTYKAHYIDSKSMFTHFLDCQPVTKVSFCTTGMQKI